MPFFTNPNTMPGIGWGQDFYNQLFPNPAGAGMPYLNQIAGTMNPYYQPYIQAGQQAIPTLQQQYNQLINDPSAMLGQFGAGYTESPGYKYQVGQATDAANRAAAAGGYLGSPQEQQQLAGAISGMAGKDYQQYLNNVMGLYGQGLQGMGGMYQTGFGAASDLATNLANALQSQANLAYAGQANQNQGFGSMLGKAVGALGGMF